MFDPPLVAVLPFALTLLAIAVLPLVAHDFWHSDRNKAWVMAVLAVPVAAWLGLRAPAALGHALLEYVSFLALIGSLFVVAGGIHLSGDLLATPARNTAWLAAGAVLANLLGTTGASMLLIRSLLRSNSERKQIAHLPFFFILIVSNCGGLLTPLADPPLFLGYLRGVPFTWTLRLWLPWLLSVGWLLGAFYVADRRAYARETQRALERDARELVPLRLTGIAHVPVLLAVVACVLLPTPYREVGMFGLAGFSLWLGPRSARRQNEFSFGPVIEVAVIFAGIFVTMVPALALLERHGAELGLRHPWQFFLVTGGLSSVLDNAPTYVALLAAAQSLHLAPEVAGVPAAHLTAISLGAVFMGANTYIGNGPNFMVRAIAESAGVRTASFFGHLFRALAVLAPVYVGITLWLAWLG